MPNNTITKKDILKAVKDTSPIPIENDGEVFVSKIGVLDVKQKLYLVRAVHIVPTRNIPKFKLIEPTKKIVNANIIFSSIGFREC